MNVSVERVRHLLGGAELQRLISRLRKRMSLGEPLSGKIQLDHSAAPERAAVDKLFGRRPTKGRSLTVDLDQLAQTLAHAGVCERLEDAVCVLVGPVANERHESLERKTQWERLWLAAIQRVNEGAAASRWIADLQSSGLLRRMASGDLGIAQLLLDQAAALVVQMPFVSPVRLAELAASATGDSHALDRGRPLGSLVLRFAKHLDESARWETAAQRRDAWETLGILCDEVSGPVLVLNLRADSESLTGRALNLHAADGEPYRVSVRQLRRHPPLFDTQSSSSEVFVCENPTVVDVAANKLGALCRPLICIDGQPKTAARLLLDALKASGIVILYHGDFDWDGIRIANVIMRRHGALPWRFGASDYAAVAEKQHRLKGPPVSAMWDPALAEIMMQTGKCVHEENVLDGLLADLRKVPD